MLVAYRCAVTRDEALERLRATLASGKPVIGAGAGTGISAKCEEAGDVDLLVVMPAKNELSQSIRIRQATDAPFPIDLLVRTPENLAKRIEWNDWFMKEVVEKGIVLYDANGPGMGP